ncbi:MAG: hypothetical protein IT180_05125 [Acidobacteria bacterium]|nr:hypothetical protein [Acidobacteriota bacterium]
MTPITRLELVVREVLEPRMRHLSGLVAEIAGRPEQFRWAHRGLRPVTAQGTPLPLEGTGAATFPLQNPVKLATSGRAHTGYGPCCTCWWTKEPRMGINKLVFAALTVGCLAAAGLGGFLAVRFGQPAASAEAPVAVPASAPASPTPAAVTESEGVITPTPAPAPAPPVAEAPRSAPRAAAPAPRPSRSTPVSRPTAREEGRRASAAPSPAPPIASAPPPTPENTGSMWETRPPVAAERPPVVEEPAPPAAPPAPEFLDLQVPADSVLGLQVERTVTSDLARVEDKVSARVTRDVRVAGRIAIPAGSIVTGSVTDVDRGGKMKGKARLAVRFHTVTLADGSQLAIRTDTVVREGQSPSGETAAKVGGATIGGAILGAILGGGKGAAIGAGVGAGAGTAAAMTNDRNPATLPAGASITVRVQEPVTVTVQKE